LLISIYVTLQAIIKPQYVDHIPKAVQGNVGQTLDSKNERDMKEKLCADLELNQVIDRNVGDLSGGELQRFAIAVVAIQNAEIYMFDEPSSYLDVKQRLKAARVVRSLLKPNRFVSFPVSALNIVDITMCIVIDSYHESLFYLKSSSFFQLCNCCRARS
jgi:ATP-binding cassette, sub-family E, member 1